MELNFNSTNQENGYKSTILFNVTFESEPGPFKLKFKQFVTDTKSPENLVNIENHESDQESTNKNPDDENSSNGGDGSERDQESDLESVEKLTERKKPFEDDDSRSTITNSQDLESQIILSQDSIMDFSQETPQMDWN
ncbi:uncharacterized protein LOC128387892 [Panonychus citri]|uniref:uncharacterized protein LOC128387892 n=1 Tax=Panonychus citri TaxID=50023 RepID=UPI0023074DF2|nr:uncharacterized protein LOC128387892 [Panonychus citri]